MIMNSTIRSYRYFIIRHGIMIFSGSFLAWLCYLIGIKDDSMLYIMRFFLMVVIYEMVKLIISLLLLKIDIHIGLQKKRFHYVGMKDTFSFWEDVTIIFYPLRFGNTRKFKNPEYFKKDKWLYGIIQLNRKKSDEVLNFKIAVSVKDLKRYKNKGVFDVYYYKYSRVIKEIIC